MWNTATCRFVLVLLILLLLISLSGCSSFIAAKKLSPEQIQAMKEVMEVKQSSGCFRGGAAAGFGPAEGNLGVATCWGLEAKPTVNEYIQMMTGVSVNVTPRISP